MYKFYIDRLKTSLKRNGFLKTLLSFPKKIPLIFRNLKPNKRRKICHDLITKYTKILPWHFIFIGGYSIKELNTKNKDEKVALCFGIYDDVNLELALNKNGYKVYAFDPTPISKELFLKNPDLEKYIHYSPWAVWSEDKKMKFFYKEDDQIFDNFEGTLEDIDHSNHYELVDAFSLKSIMNKFEIDFVDYIKMDIEGAVPEVLMAYFSSENDIDKFPYEIVFELEMPKDFSSPKADEILKKIESLLYKLNQYYKVYNVQNDQPNQNMHIHAVRIDRENM